MYALQIFAISEGLNSRFSWISVELIMAASILIIYQFNAKFAFELQQIFKFC